MSKTEALAPAAEAENFVIPHRPRPYESGGASQKAADALVRNSGQFAGELAFDRNRRYTGEQLSALFEGVEIRWPSHKPPMLPPGVSLTLHGGDS